MTALWGGRFSGASSKGFKAFNDSLPFDYLLAEQDITGSRAWAEALLAAGVLTATEQQQLDAALAELLEAVRQQPRLPLASDAEDIHAWVEMQLVERLGDIGKKLHTGRSRNDQVATDLRLWCRQQGRQLKAALVGLQRQLIGLASKHSDTVWPGYTHLQRAQPVTLGHWCLAYVEMLSRDQQRLEQALERANSCPLGCGALAGTAYPIERWQLARRLGFNEICHNSLDAVSDRDFVLDLLYCASVSMMHLSRLAEDMIFFNAGEAGFIQLSDAVTSGSSLMPQKKNPDALELIRGKTGRVFGALQGLLVTLKGLPLAYNKDMQEDKEALFDAVNQWLGCLQMANEVFDDIDVRHCRARQAALLGYANATELADYLVARGVPFRQAHHLVGELVQYAQQQQKGLEELTLAEMQAIAPQIQAGVHDCLTLSHGLSQRQAIGGTAPQQVRQALRRHQVRLASDHVRIRMATLADIGDILELINHWAKAGENLPRTEDELVRAIADFAVTEDAQGRVSGCASLYIYSTGLAEIRSLGVAPGTQGQGQGKLLVRFLLEKAAALGVAHVFVLTRVPGFFRGLGFRSYDKARLPEKVMQDCQKCPRQQHCDEEALLITLLPGADGEEPSRYGEPVPVRLVADAQ